MTILLYAEAADALDGRGACLPEGLEVLEYATRKAQKLYPECDFCIVYNNLTERALAFVGGLGLPLVNAEHAPCVLEPGPDRTEWLIWPPRLRLAAHEIAMDNDIVLLRRHPTIDMFLRADNFFFSTESWNQRHYGNYRDAVPQRGGNVNSGMYGMPPGFDFEKWLVNFYIRHGRREYHHANPQGVVAAMIKGQETFQVISNKHIILSQAIRYLRGRLPELLERDNTYGLHFAGVNRATTVDVWIEFKVTADDDDLRELKAKWRSY